MKIKITYQKLPAHFQKGVVALFLAGCLAGCTCSDSQITDSKSSVIFSASIGNPKVAVVTRATNDGKNITGTYSSFEKGASLGVYANKGFVPGMANLEVIKESGDTWSNGTNIFWDSNPSGDVEIKAYFPYSDIQSGYSLLSAIQPKNSDEYRLEDVLVSERKQISYNNPALFLTFTHRFALLHLKLGNGFDGFTGEVKATMEKGIEPTVTITDGTINLKDGVAKTFVAPTTSGTEYYILVPADEIPRKVVSLALGQQVIENTTENPYNMPDLETKPNTIYTLKAQVIDGVPVIRVVGIETWTEAEYLGTLKAKPGIYTEEELREFGDAYNKGDETALASFGEKKGSTWTIYLQENLYLTELDDLRTPENESEYTAAIVRNFTGIFEGQGFTINGLSITDGKGMFEILAAGAQVKDLILTDASVLNKTTGEATGILVGTAEAGSTITNCHIFGTSGTTGLGNTGGLVGNTGGIINRSSSFAIVNGPSTGSYFTGGLAGKAENTTIISNSFAKGWVTGQTGGALIGNGINGITVRNCYASVNVNGQDQSYEYK